jgi:hypothetical protein
MWLKWLYICKGIHTCYNTTWNQVPWYNKHGNGHNGIMVSGSGRVANTVGTFILVLVLCSSMTDWFCLAWCDYQLVNHSHPRDPHDTDHISQSYYWLRSRNRDTAISNSRPLTERACALAWWYYRVREESDCGGMVKYIGIFVSHLIHLFTAGACLHLCIVVHRWYVIPIGTAFIILTLIH